MYEIILMLIIILFQMTKVVLVGLAVVISGTTLVIVINLFKKLFDKVVNCILDLFD